MCLLPLLPEHTHPITTLSEEGMGARAWGRGSFLLSGYASVTQSGCPVSLPPPSPVCFADGASSGGGAHHAGTRPAVRAEVWGQPNTLSAQ